MIQCKPLDETRDQLVNGFLSCATSCFVPIDYECVRDDP
jgi:hypothetical protein